MLHFGGPNLSNLGSTQGSLVIYCAEIESRSLWGIGQGEIRRFGTTICSGLGGAFSSSDFEHFTRVSSLRHIQSTNESHRHLLGSLGEFGIRPKGFLGFCGFIERRPHLLLQNFLGSIQPKILHSYSRACH